MAREHARILCRIWRDKDFRALDIDAQWLYTTLLSQPGINHAGVLPFTPGAWSRLAKGMTQDRVDAALDALAAGTKPFVLVDEDSAELLVRTFIRNDGVSSAGKVFINALKVALQVQSERLRHELAVELRKVGSESAKRAAETLDPGPPQEIIDRPHVGDQKKSERPEFSCGEGEGVSSAVSSSFVVGWVGEPSPAKDSPQPPTPEPDPQMATAPKPATKRGSRIHEPFEPTDAMRDWAKANAPDVDLATQTANFVDYWAAKPGKDGVKLDWTRTWQRWMRTEQERTPSRSRASPAGGDPLEWLQGEWRSGRVSEIRNFYNVGYTEPTHRGDGDYWTTVLKPHNQAWITQHHDAILQRRKDRT